MDIYKLIADLKKELRKEMYDASNVNYEDKQSIKDNTAITLVTLAENEMLDEVTASEHSDMFLEWQSGISYKQNNIRRYGENLYKCLQSHTSQDEWTPDISPSLWKKIGDPSVEYPEWSQPIGTGDAYMIGDRVSYNDKHYVSTVDNNVWQPGVYGWQEVIYE